MLGSWLNDSAEKLKLFQEPAPVTPPREASGIALANALSTPHDAVLEQFNHELPEGGDPDKAPRPRLVFHGVINRPKATDYIKDPFDGSNMGTLIKPDPMAHPEAHITPTPAAEKNEELWKSLASVLDLQSQIANMHANMEGIGSRTGDNAKGKLKAKAPARRLWNQSEIGGEEDEGVDVKEFGEEEKQNREREEEFARLADQFEGRKEGIQDIMFKLDGLSKALTEFHSLKAPKIEFSSFSRRSSMPVTSSDISPANSSLDMDRHLTGFNSYPSPSSPILIVNTDDPGRQPFAMDSPTPMSS
ncbi:hypothetical protein C8J56DRAFT_920215 [Mycena floridula]|nr:hypothetical protein C8J56DRAFT_920215 [Mycena floridula]